MLYNIHEAYKNLVDNPALDELLAKAQAKYAEAAEPTDVATIELSANAIVKLSNKAVASLQEVVDDRMQKRAEKVVIAKHILRVADKLL